jgi:hypothetical protein
LQKECHKRGIKSLSHPSLVLVLEDITSSMWPIYIELLKILKERVPRTRVVVTARHSPQDVPSDLRDHVALILLEPLDETTLLTILRRQLEDTTVAMPEAEQAALVRASGGNPRQLLVLFHERQQRDRLSAPTHHPHGAIDLIIDPQALSPDDLVELLRAINSLYVNLGGRELTLTDEGFGRYPLQRAVLRSR